MYCAQCGTESSSDLRYCRSCGTNLKVIGKAVTLGEAIARSDRGPLPKIKEMMKNLKIDQITDDVSRALDQMNTEITKSETQPAPYRPSLFSRKEKTAAQRREKHIVKGTVSFFSGTGLMIFLYYLTSALVLKLPPDLVRNAPFEIEPLVHVLWLFGLIPMLSGVGHIIAGILIRPDAPKQIEPVAAPLRLTEPVGRQVPASVTEHTTNILNHQVRH